MKTWINNNTKKAEKAAGAFVQNKYNTRLIAGAVGAFTAKAAINSPGFAKRKSEDILTMLHPENMLPTGRGRFGKRTDNLQQSSMQGIRFNFRR